MSDAVDTLVASLLGESRDGTEALQAAFRRKTENADLAVRVSRRSGGLRLSFNGTFKGKPIKGSATYGMSRPDDNALEITSVRPNISDEDYEELLLDVLNDAPEWCEWANWAVSQTPGAE